MTTRLRLRRDDGRVYLERWGVEHPRIGGVFLHRMTAGDPGYDLHNHPWVFGSLILWGGYVEDYAKAKDLSHGSSCSLEHWLRERRRLRCVGSFKVLRLEDCHTIRRLKGRTSWSLVVHGPRRRSWGFFTDRGFVPHDRYAASERGLTVELAEDPAEARSVG